MEVETFNTLTEYFKGLIEERQHGANAISSTPTALKASVWIEPFLCENWFSIICNVHQGFQWGRMDLNQLLRQIKYHYLHLFDSDRLPEMAIHLPAYPMPRVEGFIPSPVNLRQLADPGLTSEDVLYPTGIHLTLHFVGHPNDDPGWLILLFENLKALYSLVVAGNIAQGCGSALNGDLKEGCHDIPATGELYGTWTPSAKAQCGLKLFARSYTVKSCNANSVGLHFPRSSDLCLRAFHSQGYTRSHRQGRRQVHTKSRLTMAPQDILYRFLPCRRD